MKKFLRILACAALSLFLIGNVAFALPAAPDEVYVYDDTGILTASTRNAVIEKGKALEAETTAQLCVAMVSSLEGRDAADYANELFRSWGIGQKESNNGVLVLIAPNERDVRIEVGYGLEGALPDGLCGRIIDEAMLPFLSNDDYNRAVLGGVEALVPHVRAEYGLETAPDTRGGSGALMPGQPDEDLSGLNADWEREYRSEAENLGRVAGRFTLGGLFMFIVVIVIIMNVLRGIFGFGYRRRGGWGWGGYWGPFYGPHHGPHHRGGFDDHHHGGHGGGFGGFGGGHGGGGFGGGHGGGGFGGGSSGGGGAGRKF